MVSSQDTQVRWQHSRLLRTCPLGKQFWAAALQVTLTTATVTVRGVTEDSESVADAHHGAQQWRLWGASEPRAEGVGQGTWCGDAGGPEVWRGVRVPREEPP